MYRDHVVKKHRIVNIHYAQKAFAWPSQQHFGLQTCGFVLFFKGFGSAYQMSNLKTSE